MHIWGLPPLPKKYIKLKHRQRCVATKTKRSTKWPPIFLLPGSLLLPGAHQPLLLIILKVCVHLSLILLVILKVCVHPKVEEGQ